MSNKRIFKNFGYLSVINFLTIGFPIIIYPYLNKVLGYDNFGLAIYYQTIIGYFIVFVSYGFNITGTKLISNLEGKEKNDIFWTLIIIRFLISIFSCTICFAISFTLKKPLVFILMLPLLLNEVVFPQWYYQGTENMRNITIINLITRILMIFLIILLVKNSNDLPIYTIIYSLSPFVVSLISFTILVNNDRIRYELDKKKFLLLSKRVLEKSNSVFIGTVVSVIKDKTNIIFIGLLIGNQEVVIYDFISKVINVVSGFFSSFTNAQFPRFSKKYNKESFVKYTFLIFIASIIIPFTGALFIYVIKYFNVAYLDIVYVPSFFGVYIILSFLIPMRGLAYQFGLCFLVSHGYNKEYTNSLMLSFIVYIMFSGVFYLLKINNIYILILPLVFSVLVELLHRLYVSCYKVGLDGK